MFGFYFSIFLVNLIKSFLKTGIVDNLPILSVRKGYKIIFIYPEVFCGLPNKILTAVYIVLLNGEHKILT